MLPGFQGGDRNLRMGKIGCQDTDRFDLRIRQLLLLASVSLRAILVGKLLRTL